MVCFMPKTALSGHQLRFGVKGDDDGECSSIPPSLVPDTPVPSPDTAV